MSGRPSVGPGDAARSRRGPGRLGKRIGNIPSGLRVPTAEGRAALERWAAEDLPARVPAIAAWADVFDERRYRSLTRAGEVDDHGPGYPQRTFADHDAALAWVRAALDDR
ncbi:hypothetical protein SAMN04488107_1323 [Geodermatophilus saharensis]|uniref:Uncharacterized protein n=1 Tax=Geodermatophilus saharensis TaxID=1137994 RepID=A0A239BQD4_9ACTN|nr:hypothetical protein SAMN04488107_1323 [Geodermatophilus saharensis]